MKHDGNIYTKAFIDKLEKVYDGQPTDYGQPVIELGTFLPLKQQVEMMKRSGINLSAIRQAVHDFESGVPDWRLEHLDESDFIDQIGADTAELLTKKRSILAELQYRQENQKVIDDAEKAKLAEAKKAREKELFDKWVATQAQVDTTASTPEVEPQKEN